MRAFRVPITALGMSSMLMANTAHAQSTSSADAGGTLEEVTVTAERRAVDVQKLATSVAVRSGRELLEQGKFSLRQIVEDIPGVTAVDVANTNQGGNDMLGNNITIRGITPNPPGGAGPGVVSPPPATAVYVDGIYEGLGSQYDIEQVEINRGPQGTLYGRSATSGVYAVHTANPSMDKIKGNAVVEFGNYSLQHYSAGLNLPVGERFAARLSADLYRRGEGYYNGAGGEREKTSARLKMLYKPTDDLSVLLGGALEDNETHTGYVTRVIPITPTPAPFNAYRETLVPVRSGENKHRQVWTEINWDMAAAKLTYLGALRTWEQDDDQFVGQFTASPPTFIHQLIETPFDQFITHELRLASNPPSWLDWQTGVSYYDNRVRNSNVTELIPDVGSPPPDNRIAKTLTNKDTEAYGIFGEATYSFTDATRLTAGLRYDKTKVKTDLYNEANLNFPFAVVPPGSNIVSLSSGDRTRSFNNTTFKLRLEQNLTPDNLVYASVSSGFVPGDLNISKVGGPPTPAPATLVLNAVDTETLTAYEIGSKNRVLNDTLQLNAGIFYYRYGGFQTSFQQNQLDASSVVPLAIPARNYGAELETLWQLTTSDRIGLNYNYVRSKWVDKPANYAAAYPNDYRSVVPQIASLNYEHVFRFGDGSSLTARIDGRWQSSYTEYQDVRTSAAFRMYQSVHSRTVGNLNLSWRSSNGQYSVAGYVRNFTDERYFVYAATSNVVNVNFTDPRTYGVTLSVRI